MAKKKSRIKQKGLFELVIRDMNTRSQMVKEKHYEFERLVEDFIKRWNQKFQVIPEYGGVKRSCKRNRRK